MLSCQGTRHRALCYIACDSARHNTPVLPEQSRNGSVWQLWRGSGCRENMTCRRRCAVHTSFSNGTCDAMWQAPENKVALAGMGVEDVAVFSMEWLPPPSYLQRTMSSFDDYCFSASMPVHSLSSGSSGSGSGSSGSGSGSSGSGSGSSGSGSGSSGSGSGSFAGILAPFVGIIALVIYFLAARANRKAQAGEPGQGPGQQPVMRRLRRFSLARLANRQSVAAAGEGQGGVPAHAPGGATAARPSDAVVPGALLPPGGDPKRQFWV